MSTYISADIETVTDNVSAHGKHAGMCISAQKILQEDWRILGFEQTSKVSEAFSENLF